MSVNERGGIILDRTVFYPSGGGQPGDKGSLSLSDGPSITIATTVHGDGGEIVHVPAEGSLLPQAGQDVVCAIDWPTRNLRMRVHSALHLLCALLPIPSPEGRSVTAKGGLISTSRRPGSTRKPSRRS